jgi:hypothetical protein
MHPTFLYHPTLAPSGRKFVDEATLNALGDGWVDTPTKFPPPEPQPPAKPGWQPRTERKT